MISKVLDLMSLPNRKCLLLCGVLLLAVISFLPSFKNDYTNWDDDFHITANEHVQMPTLRALKPIFTSTVNDTYIPLTILSFNLEYQFFKFNPRVCHAINLFLHLLIVVVIYFLAVELGLSYGAAAIGALIFAIHPMHVESVVWLTQRKDLLYSLLYLLSIWSYWRYLKHLQWKYYGVAIVFCFLSILSKPMALSLPLILFLLDWFYQRKFSLRLIGEKLPFIFMVIPITYLTYSHFVRVPIQNNFEAILIWVWSITFYIYQFIFPLELMPIYIFPQPVSIFNMPFAGSLVWFLGLISFIYFFRRNRWVVFAFLFYFFSIFFLLRFDVRDLHMVADRFMYLPSLGFCFLIGQASYQFMVKSQSKAKVGLCMLGVSIVLLLGIKTYQQCKVWQNSLVLWDYVIKTNPKFFPAYLHRADIYIEHKDYNLALEDINRAIEINPQYARAFNNRAAVYNKKGRVDLVLKDLNQSILFDPKQSRAYQNRAAYYQAKGRFELALADYHFVISINPQDEELFLGRGNLYMAAGNYDLALKDFNQAQKLNPSSQAIYFNRANFYKQTKQYDLAVTDYSKILEIQPQNYAVYNDRAVVFNLMGEFPKAIADYNSAINLQPNKFSYYNRANTYTAMGDKKSALLDYDQAIMFDPDFKQAISNRAALMNINLQSP